MSQVVQFFDPTPLCGWWYPHAAPQPTTPYSQGEPALAGGLWVELLEPELQTSGLVTVSWQHQDDTNRVESWSGLPQVIEGSDDALWLGLADTGTLHFSPKQRSRVVDCFLQLANRQY